MDRTPEPLSVARARTLPHPPGKSAEAFRDGDLEIRFAKQPPVGSQTPHTRDELYIVASGHGSYRVDGVVTKVATGDLLFAAAHTPHGFEDISPEFMVWVLFYGAEK